MDIIIRNGIIKNEESKKIHEIKNDAGMLKKNYDDFIKGVPGPYYDILDAHICVPRNCNQIINFMGPQIKNRIKLTTTDVYNKKMKYCSICHDVMIPNPSFSSKRKIFIEEDIYARKQEVQINIEESFKKLKIQNKENKKKQENFSIDNLSRGIKKMNINLNNKWFNLYIKLNYKKINIKNQIEKYSKKQSIIINKYYKILYKLIKSPILYPISPTETKLIWPWDLTKYQILRLNYPDYKLNPIFNNTSNNHITENYIMIE